MRGRHKRRRRDLANLNKPTSSLNSLRLLPLQLIPMCRRGSFLQLVTSLRALALPSIMPMHRHQVSNSRDTLQLPLSTLLNRTHHLPTIISPANLTKVLDNSLLTMRMMPMRKLIQMSPPDTATNDRPPSAI